MVADDINSALNSIKSLLGDNADEKIRSVMDSLSGNTTTDENEFSPVKDDILGDDNMQYILKMKGIIDEMSHANDARSNLLMSLKPYMRDNRKQSIDNALKILSLTKLSGLFKGKF